MIHVRKEKLSGETMIFETKRIAESIFETLLSVRSYYSKPDIFQSIPLDLNDVRFSAWPDSFYAREQKRLYPVLKARHSVEISRGVRSELDEIFFDCAATFIRPFITVFSDFRRVGSQRKIENVERVLASNVFLFRRENRCDVEWNVFLCKILSCRIISYCC